MTHRVLIIDDEAGIRQALKQVLDYEGMEVRAAASGGEGITVYQEYRPHLVFLDVKMAGLDGLETLTRLRDLDPHATVVMISGHGTIATAVEATQRGAFDFLEKPLDTDRLLVTVTEAEPMALWQRNQKLYLVSRAGKVIETADLGRYSRLLVIVGDNAPERAEALFDLLAREPKLKDRVTAAVFVGKRRWNLRFDNGVDVKLPEENPAAAWSRLAELQNQYGLLEKDVRIIDLRLPDQVVLRQAHPTPDDSNAPAGGKPKDKAT